HRRGRRRQDLRRAAGARGPHPHRGVRPGGRDAGGEVSGLPTAVAAATAAAEIDTGDTAWMLAATALVLMMTPALGLFCAGLVRSKNSLNNFMMCSGAIAVAGVVWALVGYSLAFDGSGSLIGGLNYVGLHDVTFVPREGTTIPHLLFMAFQATFCIITAALVSGAVVERMRFGPFLIFVALWSILVYSVLAH